MHQPNYFIISGGPGSGKTAIIDKLASRGFTTVAETGRAILREQMEAGGDATHEGDAAAYGAEMLKRGITDYKRMRGADEPVFFDRGIAELVGYFRLKGLPVPPEVASAGHEYRSNRLVFLAPPWQAIYRQDAERRQDWDEAVRTFELIREAYVEAGYLPVEIPEDTVARRVRFILDEVDAVEDED
ncbi:MAG: AAA family ATPase [Rhizobiales bacterium]|nr:AAA family ATPase [Hyphomicrobiales bacterium]